MIRLATPMDLDAVFELAVAMRQETHWKDVPFTPDRATTVWSLMLLLATSPNHVLYVAEEDGRVVGFCLGAVTVNVFVPQVPFVAELGWFVEPASRHLGLGVKLWKQVIDWGRTRGAKASIYSKPILEQSNGKPHASEVQMWQTF
jgi:GNAT superfamily N-acetyltransferase